MTSPGREAADAPVEDVCAPPGNNNKRQRLLSKACEACKAKKARCDSSRPQCDPCRRKGLECIYREKGQPGLRPGYGKSLENRMSLLENDVENISQSVQDILSHLRNGYAPNTSLAPNNQEQVPPVEAPEEVQLWQSAQPILGGTASFTSTPALEQQQLPSTQGNGPIANFDDGSLPPEPILQELVSLFFNLVYPWVPLFYRPNFTSSMFSPDRRILLHGIVVIAFRFWNKATPPLEMREAYAKASRNQILLGTIDVCSLTSTQALALLAVDAVGQGLGPRTWNIMAMLIAAAQQLSLAKSHSLVTAAEPTTPLVNNEDPDDELCMSSVETEEKRRLFWVIYSLDRFSSIPHGQSGGINTKTIRLPYPANDEDWGQAGVAPEWFQTGTESNKSLHAQHPTNLWHHNIDLLALLDRSNQLLIQPVNLSLPAHCQEWQSSFRRLDITLSTWFESLPREVREPPPIFNPMWTMVHATFHLISIRMYTVAAFPSTTSPYLRPSSSARGRCRQAVRDVASLASPLHPHELDQLGPIFAFVVWVAARSLIIIWTTGYENTYGSLPTDLEPLLNALRQMGAHWPCAQRYADTIQLILDTKNDPGGPMGLDIFNDTRRTAYGLQNRLGTLAGPRAVDLHSHAFDFLDMPILDLGDLTVPRVVFGTFPPELDGEWL